MVPDQAQQADYPGWQQPNLDSRANISSQIGIGGGGSPCWVPASSGQLPPEAVEGGVDGTSIY